MGRRGDTPGGRGRGDPIQRLDRNSGTLYRMIPLRLKPCIAWTRKKVRKMAEKVTISAHFGWNGEGVVGGQCLTCGEGRCPDETPLSCLPHSTIQAWINSSTKKERAGGGEPNLLYKSVIDFHTPVRLDKILYMTVLFPFPFLWMEALALNAMRAQSLATVLQ